MSRSEYHKEQNLYDPCATLEWWGEYIDFKLPKCNLIHKFRVYHREDGPAIISYFSNIKEIETYYVNGLCHRIDGPATIRYCEDGSIKYEGYYLLNVPVSKEDFYTPGFIDAFIMENS